MSGDDRSPSPARHDGTAIRQEGETMRQQGRRRAARIVAVANQKGGVGKTTTAVNLAACLASAGHPTLLVDIDPQANASSGVGMRLGALDPSVYDGLVGQAPLGELIRQTEVDGLCIVPSNAALAGAEVELVSASDRAYRLRELLRPATQSYPFVIIDCPPSLGLLTLNGLSAAHGVIVPIQCEYYALEGLGRLLSTIELVRENLNPDLAIEGILLTMFDTRCNLAHQVASEVVSHFGDLTYRAVIPRNVRLSESPSYGKPIIHYDRRSRGAHSYLDLTEEFLTNAAYA
jgi:chromosome partitioning protein